MSKQWRILLVVLLLGTLLSASAVQAKQAQLPAPATLQSAKAPLQADASVLLIENVGQFAEGARFRAWGGDRSIWLAEDGIWITVPEPSQPQPLSQAQERGEKPHLLLERSAGENSARRGVNLKLSFLGAKLHPRLEPYNRLETHVSYFIGNDPDQWRPDVPVWGGVRYVDLYPGIDLEVTGEGGRLVQRLVARPGADLSAVSLRVDGADALALDGASLRVTTALGEYSLPLLQVSGAAVPDAQRPAVEGKEVALPFALSPAGSRQGAAVNSTCDLLYATILGGSDDDIGNAIAVDEGANVYVTGSTESADFPTTPGARDTTGNDGYYDNFVAKLNPSGSALLYATFLGGNGYQAGNAIAVDGGGNAYVTGSTCSTDFPTTPGAWDTSFNGGYYDAFVAVLNPAGSALLYATYLGGTDNEGGSAVAVDWVGNAYVTGRTYSTDFPTTPGALDTSFHGRIIKTSNAFVAKLNPAGSALLYATYLGGTDNEGGSAIAVDGGGNAYVTGSTLSTDFPTTPGALDTSYNRDQEAFVTKLNPSGSALLYSTFLGGSDSDIGHGIAVDGGGNAYVTGATESADFPTTPGALDTSYNSINPADPSVAFDAFVAKLNPSGSALLYATYLGGSVHQGGRAIAVDGGGNAYVTGYTCSADFPATPGAWDASFNGGYADAFVAKLNPSGSALLYATFLGGTDNERGKAIAVDWGGNAYIAGDTYSPDFPATPGAWDTSLNGGSGGFGDAFVAKLAMPGTVTLQQGSGGYRGAQDTYLGQYSATTNYAVNGSLKVGYKLTTASLLRFDLSSLPSAATVTAARLEVYATGWGAANINIGSYAVIRPWVAGQATWNLAQTGNAWAAAGCNDTATDRRAAAEASLTTSGINKWYSFDLTALVGQWVGGSLMNNGVLLRQTASTGYTFMFASAESGTASQRPRLIVAYQCGGPGPTCYALTRSHTGSGSDPAASPGNSSGCSTGNYTVGQAVQLTASPAAGNCVGSWSGTGNDASTSTTNQVTMPASARTVTVSYAADTAECYALTRGHTGSGSDPAASPGNSSGCSAGSYTAGQVVQLTASPAAGNCVGSWSGTDNDASTATTNQVTMPGSARTVTVNYVACTCTPGTATLQQGNGGYSGGMDTYIYQYSATTNYAGNISVKVGYKLTNASLLRFGLSSLPSGATVTAARLEVYATGWGAANISIGSYALIRPWVAGQATWNLAQMGNPWAAAGCNDTATDRRAAAESSLTTSGINKWYSFDLTSLVGQWVNGTLGNNGVLLRQTVSTGYTFMFASAEHGTASLRPRLVVTYSCGVASRLFSAQQFRGAPGT